MSEHLPNSNTGPELSPESQKLLDEAFGLNADELRGNYDVNSEGEVSRRRKHAASHYDEAADRTAHIEGIQRAQAKARKGAEAVDIFEGTGRRRGKLHPEDAAMAAHYKPSEENESERPSRRRGPENRTSHDESRVVRQLSAEEMAARQGIIPAEEQQSSETRVNADPAHISGRTSHAVQFGGEMPTSERIREAQTDNQMTGQAEPAPQPQGPAHQVVVNSGDFSATSINIPVLRQPESPAPAEPQEESEFGVTRHEPTANPDDSLAGYDELPQTRGSALRPVSMDELGPEPDETEAPVVNPYGTGSQARPSGNYIGFDDDFEDDETDTQQPATAAPTPSATAQPDAPAVAPAQPEVTHTHRSAQEIIDQHAADGWTVEKNDQTGEYYVSQPDPQNPGHRVFLAQVYTGFDGKPEVAYTPGLAEVLEFSEMDRSQVDALSDEDVAKYVQAFAQNEGYDVNEQGQFVDDQGRVRGNPLDGITDLHGVSQADIIDNAMNVIDGMIAKRQRQETLARQIHAYGLAPTPSAPEAPTYAAGTNPDGSPYVSPDVDSSDTDNADLPHIPMTPDHDLASPGGTVMVDLDTMRAGSRRHRQQSGVLAGLRNEIAGLQIHPFAAIKQKLQALDARIDRHFEGRATPARRKQLIAMGASIIALSSTLAGIGAVEGYNALTDDDTQVSADRNPSASPSAEGTKPSAKPSPSASESASPSASSSPSASESSSPSASESPESTPSNGVTDEQRDKDANRDNGDGPAPKPGTSAPDVKLPKNVDNDTESIQFSTKDGKMIVTAKVKQGGTTSDAIFDSLNAAGSTVNLANPNNVAQTYTLVDQLAERGVDVNSIPVGQTFTLQIDPQTGQVKTM